MYVDGKQVDHTSSPRQASAARENDDFTDFVLGSAYGRSNSGGDVTMFVDDFTFISAFKSEDDVQEAGLNKNILSFFQSVVLCIDVHSYLTTTNSFNLPCISII